MTQTQIDAAYKVLNVCCYDDHATIKSSYRALAMKHHPDRGGDADRFTMIQTAYEILKRLHVQQGKPVTIINQTIPFTLEQSYNGDIIEMFTANGTFSFDLPVGTRDGDKQTYKHNNTELNVTFVQEPHSTVKRINDDCILMVDIPLRAAMIGGDVKVCDLAGNEHNVIIPAGTQPYQQITIKECAGFLNNKACTYGDLVVSCVVHIPKITDSSMSVSQI